VHVVGHALAKALGFYAATPLLGHEPRAAGHAVRGIGRTEGPLASVLGVSLGALAGMPPSPLFASEVLIVAGGFAAGRPWTAAVAAVLLALGFLGLAHALIETVAGKAPARDRVAPGLHGILLLTGIAVPCLLGLTVAALWLPESAIARALVQGIR
jgi:formate hydrogenlyase subunit 3/multisubunit Na+/H+ antiporter MnhD subunit